MQVQLANLRPEEKEEDDKENEAKVDVAAKMKKRLRDNHSQHEDMPSSTNQRI